MCYIVFGSWNVTIMYEDIAARETITVAESQRELGSLSQGEAGSKKHHLSACIH